MKNFGERLKKIRNDSHTTQDTLAEYLGVSYQAVSKWENSIAFPDITLVPAIANFFGVTADYLLGVSLDNTNEKIEIWNNLNEYIKTELSHKVNMVFDVVPYLGESEDKPYNAKFGGHPNSEGCKIWGEALGDIMSDFINNCSF